MTFSDAVHIATVELGTKAVHVMGILRQWGSNEMAIAEKARQRPRGATSRSIVLADQNFDPSQPSARLLTSSLQPDGYRRFLDLAALSPDA